MAKKAGRNDPCPCGSGRKYKQCCDKRQESFSRFGLIAIIAIVIFAAVVLAFRLTGDSAAGPRQVWSAEHGHYHTVP